MTDIIFLKLGGSLITDKTKPFSARFDNLDRLGREIKAAAASMPRQQLVLGHGSGSFGHFAVKESLAPHRYTPEGEGRKEDSDRYWRGFAEVWYRASQLNRYVVDALHKAGLPVVSFPPSAMAHAANGKIDEWDVSPLKSALTSGLVPIIYGDIVFDAVTGGTILSTEMLMLRLAAELEPRSILLAGLEAAVWADFPERQQPVQKITATGLGSLSGSIGGSHGTDVTGGMRSKVEEMLELVRKFPSIRVQIFSGEKPGNVQRALQGEALGTLIAGD